MIKTSYFWKAKHEPDTSETYVSISRQKMRDAETKTRTGHHVKVPAIYRNTTYSKLQA